jgi:nucleoside-diphosphate-sugar epimerase
VKRALVTGDEGLVGGAFRRHLEATGWLVQGCDIKSGMDCRRLFARWQTRFDLVIHAAAIVGGRATIDGQPLRVATDLAIDSDFVQFVARTRPTRAVYFSSSAAYPVSLQTQDRHVDLAETFIDLDRPEKPDAVYGWVKLTGEQIIRHANAEGAAIHIYRPFSGYGPDQDLDYPWPSFIRRAINRVDPFPVWGSGEQVRDWVHVDDVVGAVMATVGLAPDVLGPLNIGTGIGRSMRDVIGLACEAAGYSPTVEPQPDAPVGVHHRVADVTNLRRYYQPKIALEDAIAAASGASQQP